MSVLNDQDRKELLKLARAAIAGKLKTGDAGDVQTPASVAFQEKKGCFVTLQKNGNLRGCIGTIEPVMPLADGIKDNALNSAFRDTRFSPVKTEELSDIDIEISVLSVPKKLDYKDAEDLKRKLKPGVHGVILSKGFHRSTFLPQVWDQLPDVEMFLSHLCRKGGMASDAWKAGDIEVQVYEVEHFSE